MKDRLSENIMEVMNRAGEPLETAEIISMVSATRTKVLYRLRNIRGSLLIKGKAVGSGKQAWIWWAGK